MASIKKRKAPAAPPRPAFHLSLRPDDPYESRLHEAIRRMPRGLAKGALVNMIREFVARDMSEDEMHALLMDFAQEVRPVRLSGSPAPRFSSRGFQAELPMRTPRSPAHNHASALVSRL